MVGLASIESPHNTQEAGPWATVESDINRGDSFHDFLPLWPVTKTTQAAERNSQHSDLFQLPSLLFLNDSLDHSLRPQTSTFLSFFRSHQNFSVPLQKLAHEWWMIWELQESGLFSLSWLNLLTIYPIRYKNIFYLICLYTSCYLGYTLQLLYTSSAWILYIKIMVHFKLFWYQIP